MAILTTDIKFYLSGGAVNIFPAASLGGIKSATPVMDDTLNNLFDDVTGAEHVAGDTNYRCIYVKNDSAETASNVRIYIDTNTPAIDDTINIGKDLAGAGDGATTGVADTIADEATAPDPAVTFTTAADYANAIVLGTLTAGQVIAVWIKRIVTAGTTAQSADSAILKVSVDTL
jgi:hypothetical protein